MIGRPDSRALLTGIPSSQVLRRRNAVEGVQVQYRIGRIAYPEMGGRTCIVA